MHTRIPGFLHFFTICILAMTHSGVLAQNEQSEYYATVTFPAGYAVGDYVEFLKVQPLNAWSSGYYEVSVSYTRADMAAAATHVASISHANPDVWREVGRVNSNSYRSPGRYNFTVDCNTEYGNPRFRVRAVNTQGNAAEPITVHIKVSSLNRNANWTVLNARGNGGSVSGFLPMTDEWSLYTGNAYSASGAAIAIRALSNGNVGIGAANPTEKLAVNGTIRGKEIKVESGPWPDYVFDENYDIKSLSEVEQFIKTNKHLPGIPNQKDVKENGISLGEMNRKLLEKVEELTLHLIEKDKIQVLQSEKISDQEERISALEEALNTRD